MSTDAVRSTDVVFDSLTIQKEEQTVTKTFGVYTVEVVRDGVVIDTEMVKNLITNQGIDHMRGAVLLAGTQITAWHLIPISATPTVAAADTYATQAGWAEVVNYAEATRPAWTGVAGATGVSTNSAARAEFTMGVGGSTLGGVAMVGGGAAAATKNDTAGGGTLLSASVFSGGNRVLQQDDILRVTWQHTFSNA